MLNISKHWKKILLTEVRCILNKTPIAENVKLSFIFIRNINSLSFLLVELLHTCGSIEYNRSNTL